MAETISRDFYRPEGVTEYVGLGTDSFVGAIDQTTVLKYPKTPGDEIARSMLQIEAQILTTIGPHKHIIGYKGLRGDGVLLERALNGSVAQYLKDHAATTEQRLAWARQASEAVAMIHKAGVIHCDINVNNLLLDHNLMIKICDFQGLLLRADGSVDKDGFAKENVKSFMPRTDNDFADKKTDIFALGSALHYLMEGHEPFPELNSIDDEEEIKRRFVTCQFPKLQSRLMNRVIHRCWAGKYDSAEAVLQDLGSKVMSPIAKGVKDKTF